MQIVAIKDMAAGNEEVGRMWQETKVFNGESKVKEIMQWAGDRRIRVTQTVPADEEFPEMPF